MKNLILIAISLSLTACASMIDKNKVVTVAKKTKTGGVVLLHGGPLVKDIAEKESHIRMAKICNGGYEVVEEGITQVSQTSYNTTTGLGTEMVSTPYYAFDCKGGK